MSVVSKCKWLSKPQERQAKSIKNVKIPKTTSPTSKCGNNRVMCEWGGEQWWTKKEKVKQKAGVVYYKR